MRKTPYPLCCGGYILCDFGLTLVIATNEQNSAQRLAKDRGATTADMVAEIDDWLAEQIDDATALIAEQRDGKRPFDGTPGFFQVVLNGEQRGHLHETMLKHGFRVVADRVVNTRHGTDMTIYLRVNTSENNG